MDLEIDRRATTERVQLDDTSWVDVTRGFVRDPAGLMDELIGSLAWAETSMFRYEVFVNAPRLNATIPAGATPPAIRQTALHLDAAYRKRFTGPQVLRYRHGNDSVGLHRDRSMRWLDDTLIGIVVLGEPRSFLLRPHAGPRDDTSRDVDLMPGNGDLIVLGGRNQADWMHGVPKVPTASERISLTCRWTSRRGRPDDSEDYGAARRFGDSGRVGPQRQQ